MTWSRCWRHGAVRTLSTARGAYCWYCAVRVSAPAGRGWALMSLLLADGGDRTGRGGSAIRFEIISDKSDGEAVTTLSQLA